MIKYQRKEYICFLDLAMEIIRKKWSSVILCHLSEGSIRFLDLQKRTKGISQKVLTETLKKLEKENLVIRKVYPDIPPKVEYFLSEKGVEISKILLALEGWSKKYYSDSVELGENKS